MLVIPASLRGIYDQVLRVAKTFGPVEEDPKKTSIHLVRRTAFAGVATRRDALVLTLKSDRNIADARIHKAEQASAHRWHLEVRLKDVADVDAQLKGWLQSAYELAG
ncbi:MAG TPA: DUF5655 domain-containing protein [Thermoanaerobaculia bacterium]|nr:DUF5655 domain-containing protein [Thermoanaerobaculia bacterium]